MSRGFEVGTTRREFCHSVGGALVVAGVSAGCFGFADGTHAQTAAAAELMKPGPLPEEAQGNADAPVTLIEYASMTCSHCANFDTQVYPTLKSKYIDPGKVRYIMREFPLDPLAAAGFMLARCAGEGKYFAMIDVLFKMQPQWAFTKDPVQGLLSIAKQAGFSEQRFNECVANQKLLDDIDAVRQHAAEKLGVNSTPTFFINGQIHRGEMTLEDLDKVLAPYLKS
jgi:protein-disulfide isomerase